MTSALILGNGPSLDHLDIDYADFDVVIATNRLIASEHLMDKSNVVYVAADVRFANSSDWLKAFSRYQGSCWLGPDLFELLTWPNSERFRVVPDQLSNELAKKFAHTFPALAFPYMNVVLDFALPVALNYAPSEVTLGGVDFDYGLDEFGRAPRYWKGYEKISASFDHTHVSAESWSRRSKHRLLEMATWLRNRDLGIQALAIPHQQTLNQ